MFAFHTLNIGKKYESTILRLKLLKFLCKIGSEIG